MHNPFLDLMLCAAERKSPPQAGATGRSSSGGAQAELSSSSCWSSRSILRFALTPDRDRGKAAAPRQFATA
jgi:hypothetical protein